jgi:hypothetical protein
MLVFLDRFGRMYGENKCVGAEMMTAIAELQLQTSAASESLAHVKVALMASIVTCNHVVDGVAKILTTKDLESLKAKKVVQASLSCEADIKRALLAADRLIAGNFITECDYDELLGVYMLRRILHLIGKGKLGPEGKQFEPEECNQMFIEAAMQMSKLPANEIDSDWGAMARPLQVAFDPPPVGEDETTASSSGVRKSLSDHTDGGVVMREYKYKLGDAVCQKGSTSTFLIESVSPGDAMEATVRLLEHKQFEPGSLIINIKVEVFVKKFSNIRIKDLPSTLDDLSCNAPSPLATFMTTMDTDLVRCQVYKALIAFCKQEMKNYEESEVQVRHQPTGHHHRYLRQERLYTGVCDEECDMPPPGYSLLCTYHS